MPTWTDDQKKAIYEPSGEGNILVSAAAGSGKTAVLVERIANMVIEKGVSIDELLVVTFTEAAASEMRERIISRISKAYREAVNERNADKSHYLKEQMRLAANSDINTIDSFCLNVVKNNFHVLGVDPNFGIMDTHEGDMLVDDTLSDLFMSLYATDNEAEKEKFTSLVNVYASNRDDEGLKKIVKKLYNFSQSFPEPMHWLREKADMYDVDMTESRWIRDIIFERQCKDIIYRQSIDWELLIEQMLAWVEDYYGTELDCGSGPEKIREASLYWGDKLWKNVCMCKKAVESLKTVQEWDDMVSFYKTYIEKKSVLGNAINTVPKDIEADEQLWQCFYRRYDMLRNYLREDCSMLIHTDKEGFNKAVHADELKQTVDDFVWLTEKFNDAFEEKKNTRNLKSFSDIEHLAYRLFSEYDKIRSEYAQRYTEILIDEFQDTNELQTSIFSAISRNNMNMFMVGDLKQSIYRFRGGDPTIFKAISHEYEDVETSGKKITLSQNFRSRIEVINGVNSLFSEVMSDVVGDVQYEGDEMLQRDAERECYEDSVNLQHPTNKRIGYKPELYRLAVIDSNVEDGESVSADYGEAAFIADKIRELVDGHFQISDRDGGYRDIEYGDIAILMRSVKTNGPIMEKMLKSRGIPSFVQKEEYFERREIKLMLSLISLINNHMQDIPLAAVMRSPIGGFNENELARIRINNKNGSFYNAVAYFRSDGENDELLQRKCRKFIFDLSRWREYVKTKSIASLIWTLYEETGIYDFMGALEGGEEAQANLKLLYERAKKYEASGFKGIFNFIRYVERMGNRNDDISGARLVSEKHSVVRIMTIHKSKGLEFPVVFVARTTKRFVPVMPGDENRIMLHKDLGIGIDYHNYENMYRKKLIFTEYIKEVNRKEYLSEEMRLLYVAVTRAREKLYITCVNSYNQREDYKEKLDMWNQFYSDHSLTISECVNVRSYSDWIIPALYSNTSDWLIYDEEITTLIHNNAEEEKQEEIIIENENELRESVQKILEFKYDYTESGRIPAKTSVTAIKEMEDSEHTHEDDPVFMTQKPKFLRGEKLGAQIGTIHHQVMAFINIEKMKQLSSDDYEEFVRSEISRIYEAGQIEKDIIDDEAIVDMICENVCAFFKSDMGSEVFGAKRVYRESPFEIEISATEYDPELDEKYSNEAIVVQGIIDLYFEDKNGDIILVDYKTDRCKTIDEQMEVARKYSRQLELYSRAMEKILKKSVKDKYLYLFSAKSVVKLEQ